MKVKSRKRKTDATVANAGRSARQPNRIIVTTDFSAASRKAFPYAAAFAEKANGEIVLLNVLEPPSRVAGWDSVLPLPAGDAAVGRAYDRLDALMRESFQAEARVKTHLRTGKPFREITKAARELDAELIIMATHGYSGLTHAFLGSTTERVVRHASCPVLAVRGGADKTSKSAPKSVTLRHIVLATDLSENSLKAFPHARSLAAGFDARVTILHVVEPLHADMHMDTSGLQREHRRQAQELLRALVAREFAAPIEAKAELCAGHPVHAITRFARESGADLIVLATHGRTGLRRALIGSVAERVVRLAQCPVLVVREAMQ